MLTYTARHGACGTPVSDALPDGYPVEEGVGLYCPSCGVGFWHVDESAPADAPADATQAPVADAPPPAPPAPLRGRRPPAWPALALIAATAFAVGLVVAVLTRTGDDPPPHSRPAAPSTAAPAPAATVTATPAAVAVSGRRRAGTIATRRLGPARVRVPLPSGWRLGRARSRLVVTRGRDARIVVSVAPRRGRSLARLGRDLRADLGARRAVVHRVRLGHRRGVRVTGRGRELTGLVLGSRRFVVARDAGTGRAARVAHGIRLRP